MIDISLDKTVSALAAELPGAAELFRRAGINFCCGGNVPLADAASKAGLVPEALVAELEALATAAGRDAPEETGALIDHLISRYHQVHREELEWLIPLAQKVERVHGDHPNAPLGLADALIAMREDLDGHMHREEQLLFPMMRRGGSPMIDHPLAQMRDEHDDTAKLLAEIEHATHGLALPAGACGSWTALYTGVAKFCDDLVTHMHLEDGVLFPRFERNGVPA
ncbi:regulator of cell morphogenesis and NO signaling [Mycoplana sp. BE70]|uniref:iron-sulfur cluster repair di-iron protein n=1 Tax=Mycoplana sp. BE70 TaxID=2817775 RepID=UPI0028562AA9|nr:iron-sulfur cluster repair di-iron protein [Mycoplana sp. BE70]MDR6756300.1 regulator of cell morphogenesis and NO signaling [Mycoplana sp. BE70]